MGQPVAKNEDAAPQTTETITIKSPKAKKSEALWMMTFSDMSFILMCFFALLISFSKPNKQQFENVVEGMAKKPTDHPVKKRNLKDLERLIKKEIRKRKLENVTEVNLDNDGLRVEFKSKLLFSSGSANVNRSFRRVTGQIMKIIAQSPPKYQISVEGHTDDTPLGKNGRYQTNWDLSAARSISLVQQFRQRGAGKNRIRILAYADTRPKVPIGGKTGKELRAARDANRRVVIRLE